jgi:hypothetical protein
MGIIPLISSAEKRTQVTSTTKVAGKKGKRPEHAAALDLGEANETPMLEQIWHYSISDGIPRRSLIVALVVGTIINLINQGDALIGELPLDITKLLATYVVSYFVSTYGAVSYRLHVAGRTSGEPANKQLTIR